MTCLFDKLTDFANRFSDCEELSDCRVLIAYPNLTKPTELNQIVIAVSIGEIDASCIELGGTLLDSKYILNASVYAPFEIGTSALQDIIEPIIKCQLNAYPAGVKIDEIKTIEQINCFCVRCSFTFNDEICIGG